MRKILQFVITIVVVSILIYQFSFSQNEDPKRIFSQFKLQVFEDNKPTKFYLVGHLWIYKHSGEYQVDWYDVWISSLDSEKKMMLKPEYNSVSNGDIKNVTVADDHFSFDINLATERVMKISGTRKKQLSDYQIDGVGLFWIDMLKKNVKTEWRTVTTPIMLPFSEIY